jgi:ArsR family transcriptional regulator
MTNEQTILALASLAQSTRLDTFKLLVAHEPDGLAAGEISKSLSVPHNTLSSHLAILSHAGLISSTRHSRSIVYRANLGRLQEVIVYLLKDCCGGRSEICAPLMADLVPCCPPKETADV